MVVRAKIRLPTLESFRALNQRLLFGSKPGGSRVSGVAEDVQTETNKEVIEQQSSLVRLAEQLDAERAEPFRGGPSSSKPSIVNPPPQPELAHLEEAGKTGIELEGCKVAAIGFGRQEIGNLAACMIEHRARIEFMPRGGYNGREYDLLLLNTGPVETFKKGIPSFAAALQSGIPSIITGSRSVFTTVREIGGAHAWDFVPKPFRMDELAWRAANLLARHRKAGAARQFAESPAGAEQDRCAQTHLVSEQTRNAAPEGPNLSFVDECQPPTGDGTFRVLEPSCQSEYVEQFRLLRTQLMLHRTRFDQDQHFRVVCVMSTQRGEGKSFTASNLAAVLAVAGTERVLLVDSDPESPPLDIGLTLPEDAGLTYALSEPADWARAVRRVKGTRLYVMARGGTIPRRNLDFSPLPDLLRALRAEFEWIILDGAAFASCPDAQWLTAATDGTLLVVRENASSFGAVRESLASIPPERLVGIVFNHWRR